MDQFHISEKMEETSSESISDEEVKTESDLEPNTDSDNESESTASSENDNSSGSEAEEEDDFWHLLIESVAAGIYEQRKTDGKPGVLPFITHPKQIAEGEYLSHFTDQLRLTYNQIERIYNAGCDDSVLNLIEDEFEKQRKHITDEQDSKIQAKVWKKNRALIRKKMLQNLDDLKVLVGKSV